MSCKKNKLEGTFKEYYENGKLWIVAKFKDGKPYGIVKTYYRNGELEYLDTYENSKKINMKAYDNEGKLRFDQNYTR